MPTHSRKYIRERLQERLQERRFELMKQMDIAGKVNYPLCGGHICIGGNNNFCNVATPMMKDYSLGWRKSNTVLCCCSIAQAANENNLRTEEQVRKHLRDIVLNPKTQEDLDILIKLVNEN
jgi:hypothetical protein